MMQFLGIFRLILALVALGFIIIIHEFGHFISAKFFNVKVTEFMLGLPGPKLFSFKKGDTTYGLTAIPFGGYVKMVGSELGEKVAEEDKSRSFTAASFWKKTVIVLAGPLMNLFLAFVLLMSILLIFKVLPDRITTKIGQLQKGKPAAKAGVKVGDKIIAINDKPTPQWKDIKETISSKPNQPVVLTIKRNKQILKLMVVTEKVNKKGFLGIMPVVTARKAGFFEAIKESFRLIRLITTKIYEVIFRAITGKPRELLTGSRGPVGIVLEIAKFATNVISLVLIFVSINVAVAIVNLLPIPPLDFGRVVLLIVEKIKGSEIDRRVLVTINAVGMALLLLLLIYVTYRDIFRITQYFH